MSEIESGGYREIGGYRIERNRDKHGDRYLIRARSGDLIDSTDSLATALHLVADYLEAEE